MKQSSLIRGLCNGEGWIGTEFSGVMSTCRRQKYDNSNFELKGARQSFPQSTEAEADLSTGILLSVTQMGELKVIPLRSNE